MEPEQIPTESSQLMIGCWVGWNTPPSRAIYTGPSIALDVCVDWSCRGSTKRRLHLSHGFCSQCGTCGICPQVHGVEQRQLSCRYRVPIVSIIYLVELELSLVSSMYVIYFYETYEQLHTHMLYSTVCQDIH